MNINTKKLFSVETIIAVLAIAGLVVHCVLRFGFEVADFWRDFPLFVVLLFGGIPLVYELLKKLVRGQFGSDLLAGISIVTSIILGEYAAGSLVVLMLSGGEALEHYAVEKASSVLSALAQRMPNNVNKKTEAGIVSIFLTEVQVGDLLVVSPHDICPVDGVVIEGRTVMDESYLTGEPYHISKVPGSSVTSGAINGEGAITVRAMKLPVDSRYARIMEVMKRAETERPRIRRLGDFLGAIYTPIAVVIATIAWAMTGEASRFLSVLVVATPCPVLIAIPITIIGSISLCAKRGIIVKNPTVFEQINNCEVVILDKTGTLTYGEPSITEVITSGGITVEEIVQLAGSLEQFSKHPLASAFIKKMEELKLKPLEVSEMSEQPGSGLCGKVGGRNVWITNRKNAKTKSAWNEEKFSIFATGMECCAVIDDTQIAVIRFHDMPREDSGSFIKHLDMQHSVGRVMIISGDRESEVSYLAEQVGIKEIYADQSPEQKVERVKRETAKAHTLYIGDGINDAPALMSATVGIALGQNSDITAEAAGAVILDSTLKKVDELFHISRFTRTIALQSAVGGMALSIIGMGFAASGHLTPVMGAIGQEVIDLFAVVNALRVAIGPKRLTDY